MRSTFVKSFAIGMVVLLAACGSDKKSETTTAPTTAAPATTASPGTSAAPTTAGGATTAAPTTAGGGGGGGGGEITGNGVDSSFTAEQCGAPASGGDGKPITFGVITSLTGPASSSFSDVELGVKAYVDAINAKGGVNGHQLKYIMADDQSNPTQNLTAVKDLVENKGVTAIAVWDPFLFVSADYLLSKNMPTIGGSFDGPEWGQSKYSNMFGVVGVANPKYPAFTSFAEWIKSKGVTKIASLAYGSSPSAIGSAKGSAASAKTVGIDTVYTNYNVPFGSTDFTADALAIKQSGADMVLAPMVQASDIALNTALKQANANVKVSLFYTGYDQNTLNDPAALAGFEGAYVVGTFRFIDGTNAAATAMMDNLHAAGYKGDIPTFGSGGGYTAAAAVACGLQAAGANPTPETIIANLRKVTAYDEHGIALEKTDFSKQFDGIGSFDGGSLCQNWVQVVNGKFVLDTKEPLCGENIPGTDTA